jgi:hypothetical protein
MSGPRRVYRAKPGELQARRIEKAAPAASHSPGWPHYDRRGNCLCTQGCCIAAGGCRCRSCTHQSHPKEKEVPDVLKGLVGDLST